MKLRWLGHSCFIIEGNDKIVVDPFITGNPLCTVSPDDIRIDMVAITHSHEDHLGDGIHIALKNNAPLIAIHEIAVYAASKGVNAEGINIGGGITVNKTNISMTPAWHSSGIGKPNIPVATCPAGLIINSGKIVYLAGDTCLFSDMKLIQRLFKPDIALLPIGGRYTMDTHQAAIAAEWINAKVTIPMHYNTFDIIKQDPQEFKTLAEENAREVVILKPGEEITI